MLARYLYLSALPRQHVFWSERVLIDEVYFQLDARSPIVSTTKGYRISFFGATVPKDIRARGAVL